MKITKLKVEGQKHPLRGIKPHEGEVSRTGGLCPPLLPWFQLQDPEYDIGKLT